VAEITAASALTLTNRRRTADQIYLAALAFNGALTAFWIVSLVSGFDSPVFSTHTVDGQALVRVAVGVLVFYVLWGLIWYGVKTLLLAKFVGFSKEERRQAFSSRMDKPFDVGTFVARHSERRIRIADMIGRRGRFVTLAMAGFFYMYLDVTGNPSAGFATRFLQDNLFDAVAIGWIFLAFYYRNGWIAAAFYGPQSRVMDGVLARANCLLITTLWAAFKFILLPIGAQLATVFPPSQFAIVFALIWGSYLVTDALSEIGGSLFGRQQLRVWGIGDVNRKSVGGTVSGFVGGLVFCAALVMAHQLPAPWVGLAFVIAISNTAIELWSPRGTDDFFMATANALICLAFGVLMVQRP
jgi:hypothetical protein